MNKMKYILVLVLLITSFSFNFVEAAPPTESVSSIDSSIESKFLPIIQCGTGAKPCTFLDAIETFNRIVNWFVSIAATLGALTMAYAGGMMLLNPGNTGKLEEAKEMFRKTMVGLIWLLVAWVIVYSLAKRFIDPTTQATRFLE